MKILQKAVVVTALVLVSSLAVAGYKESISVTVNITGKQAFGSAGTARNSTDAQQRIGCWVAGYADNTFVGGCHARNSIGTGASCFFSKNDALARAIQAQNSDSYLYFAWDTAGQCTHLYVNTFSAWEPKK